MDVVSMEERTCDAGIFGSDKRHLAQDAQGAQGDVFKVPDWRGHHVQPSHVSPFGIS
jgi:hypothetical protein